MRRYLSKDNFQKILRLPNIFKTITPVIILSSMRSGSTLLKSLLANAPDTSYLPEVNFQMYNSSNAWKIKLLSNRKIIILKRPASYFEEEYPQIPSIQGLKKIVLVRDVYETVMSLKKMNAKIHKTLISRLTNQELVETYWYGTYNKINKAIHLGEDNTMIVRYEDLVSEPKNETKRLFNFIGSTQGEGVDSYKKPSNFEWKWGKDDGGEMIKTLQVQKNNNQKEKDLDLIKVIENSEKVMKMRTDFGYDKIL